jgi:hypothetical protein
MRKKSTKGSQVFFINEPTAFRIYEIYDGPQGDQRDSLGKMAFNIWKENNPKRPVIYTCVSLSQIKKNKKLREILSKQITIAM